MILRKCMSICKEGYIHLYIRVYYVLYVYMCVNPLSITMGYIIVYVYIFSKGVRVHVRTSSFKGNVQCTMLKVQ